MLQMTGLATTTSPLSPASWTGRPSMHTSDRRREDLEVLPPTLLLLTVTTGLIDAVSFLGLGHIFTANMTGNVVFLAFAIAGAAGLSISASLLALGCFLG